MAEAVGVAASLVSLASLFSTCIECFSYYRATKECPRQIKMKLVKLDFEKTRLLIWANQVGLVSTDSRSRNPGIERNEASLRQTMEQIQLLLAEANRLQDKYGVRQQEQPVAAIETYPDLVSRNSLTTFTTSYSRFRGKFFEPSVGPKLTARVRWAILDENKFEGLIKTLKDFVDNLFWLVEVERNVQDHIVEEDIMAVTSLLELELIKDASEHDYQVWSDVASRAVDRTERGTVPNTDTDDQDISEVEHEGSRGRPELPHRSVVGHVYSSHALTSTVPPACFVLTDLCVSFSHPPPCLEVDENHDRIFGAIEGFLDFGGSIESHSLLLPGNGRYSLGRRLYTQFRIGNWTREDIQRVKSSQVEIDLETSFATVFIYVPPCERLLLLAYHILLNNKSAWEFYSFRIRVDDRLNVSCCPPAAAHDRLVALLKIIRRRPRLSYEGDAVDEIWLEQRIQANAMDEHQFEGDRDPANRYRHLYVEESYNPLETIGAIVLLGEEDQIREVMSSESYPRHPHVPRAGEIYSMHRKANSFSLAFARHYLGTYVPNPRLIKKSAPSPRLVQPQPEPGLALAQAQLANGAPSAKRRKVLVDDIAHHETSQAPSQAETSESSASLA